MQYFQGTKRVVCLYLVSLLLIFSTLTIFPASARADENQSTSNAQETVCIAIEKEALERAKNGDSNLFEKEDVQAIAAIASASVASASLGSVTVLTYTTAAHGILALLGAGTTTVVALPVAGILASGGLLAYGGYKVINYMQSQEHQADTPCLLQP